MDHLSEHPYLFVNGKFHILDEGHNLDIYKVRRVSGLKERHGLEFFSLHPPAVTFVDKPDFKLSELVANCTLVARRTVDMTVEELEEFYGHKISEERVDSMREAVADKCSSWEGPNSLLLRQFFYLISIGVYPFEQEDFDTKKVLDINEVTEMMS